MKAILIRNEKTDCNMGVFILTDKDKVIFTSNTLELPWKNNEFQVSCIPTGTYKCTPRTSEKFKKHFYVENVEDRDTILIHVGNYTKDTHGCILLGVKNTENTLVKSRITLDNLLKIAPKGFELTVL